MMRYEILDRLDWTECEPIGNRKVQLLSEVSFWEVAAYQRTDCDGEFHFDDGVSDAPLRVSLSREDDQPDYSLYAPLFLEPGEVRNGGNSRHKSGMRNRARLHRGVPWPND